MKETEMRFNMDLLVRPEFPYILRGQPPLTFPGGEDAIGDDLSNLDGVIKDCFTKLQMDHKKVCNDEYPYGYLYHAWRWFGEEYVSVNICVTIQDYDSYLPACRKHLLEEIKTPDKELKHFDHHHSSGNENDDCKYICVVLNNEVYPCDDRKRSYFNEFYNYAVNAMYDKMAEVIHEKFASHGYGDIYDRDKPEIEVMSREEITRQIEGGNSFENTLIIGFYDDEEPEFNAPGRHSHPFYYKVPDIWFDELEECGYTYESYWPEAEYVAHLLVNVKNTERVICTCEHGQSRSPGCAAAISDFFYRDGIKWFADEKYTPSKLVYRKMKEALEKAYRN